ADRSPELLERPWGRPTCEIRSAPDDERELRELGGLERGRPEADPAPCTVHARTDREPGEAEQERPPQQRRRERAQLAEVAPCRDDEQREPDACVRRL